MRMQDWVVNAPGLGHSQPGVAASAPASTYNPPSQPHTQSQTRHVTIPQPKAQSQIQAAQNASPSRSRSPIVNANAKRASAATRIGVSSRSAHSRDASVNLPRNTTHRAISSEPLQHPKRPPPFWDASTIEGSAFSDTTSNNDSNPPVAYRPPPAQTLPASTYQQHAASRHRPAPKQSERAGQDMAFLIGHNGLINVVGNGRDARHLDGNNLTRSASTPEARSQRGTSKEVASDNEHGPYPDGSSSTTSPEKSPSKRLQHPKTMALRQPKRESYLERVSFLDGDASVMPPPLVPQRLKPYLKPSHPDPEEATQTRPIITQTQPERLPRLVVPDQPGRRSTIFADTDTPMVSHPDEAEEESVGREPSPQPVPKPKTQVNRQLFAKTLANNTSLRESAMPKPSETRRAATKKRSYELDYDDGTLASMDYAALKQEAFDYDPAQAEARFVVDAHRGTLPEKLDHFFHQDEASQAEFFTKMPIKDWEASGDWFLSRFTELMGQFKEVRSSKRAMVDAFENEIAEREEAVRNKIHGIGQTLAELKAEGEGMILGKEFD
ncbi:hypothetical protein GGS20DRAFT_224920 [Poronia punctata]|nr:hypothetical protein GGS20DRAFT_224920 [Poronia punctata]